MIQVTSHTCETCLATIRIWVHDSWDTWRGSLVGSYYKNSKINWELLDIHWRLKIHTVFGIIDSACPLIGELPLGKRHVPWGARQTETPDGVHPMWSVATELEWNWHLHWEEGSEASILSEAMAKRRIVKWAMRLTDERFERKRNSRLRKVQERCSKSRQWTEGNFWLPSPVGTQWAWHDVMFESICFWVCPSPPLWQVQVLHISTYHTRASGHKQFRGLYSGTGKGRRVPGRGGQAAGWFSDVWADRVSDPGDKYNTGVFWWEFWIMPGTG